MKAIILLVILLLAGCVTSSVWYNPTVTQAQANKDHYECEQDSEAYTANIGAAGNPFIATGRFNQCMRVRGYMLVNR